jgi:hypothetical protein
MGKSHQWVRPFVCARVDLEKAYSHVVPRIVAQALAIAGRSV